MTEDEILDREFSYTTYADSCKDLYSPFYLCRRPKGHKNKHAAGFGESRVKW